MQPILGDFYMRISKAEAYRIYHLNNKRSAISSFFSVGWLMRSTLTKIQLRKIKKIKVTKKKKKAFTADEMERMRIACTGYS